MIIRPFRAEDDDVVALTDLLHRAYAPLAARNLRFTATHQSPEVTLKRLLRGTAFMAESEGRVVGTVSVYSSYPTAEVALYRDPQACHFGQFGVDPDFKGRGIGSALHRAVIAEAQRRGLRRVGLDTAEGADDLIAMYRHWGYKIVDRFHWENTNYESVIMGRELI